MHYSLWETMVDVRLNTCSCDDYIFNYMSLHYSTYSRVNCIELAAYIIVKLLVYSIWDSTHKISMDYSKFHMMCDVTWCFFCPQAEVNASDIADQAIACA